MPPAPQGQQQNPDNHMAAMWISLGVFFVVVIIWYIFRDQIVSAIFAIKMVEAKFIGLFTNNVNHIETWMATVNPRKVTISQLAGVSTQLGSYFEIPVILLSVVYGAILFNRSVGGRYKTIYTMKSLLKQEIKNWPQAIPVMQADLIEQDIDEGPWAMAKSPMQFARDNNLIKVQKKAAEEGMLKKDIRFSVTLVKAKANQLFVKQLGPVWRDADHLPMHLKALFAVFAARIAGDADSAHDLLMQILRTANSGKLNFAGVTPLLNKHRNNKVVVETIHRHAYVSTVLTSLLEIARATGVLASADFLWLKVIDRRMWYVLNTVGRQTPTAEVAGPFAHWRYEKSMGRAFRTPMIDEAAKALDKALQEQIYLEAEDKAGNQ